MDGVLLELEFNETEVALIAADPFPKPFTFCVHPACPTCTWPRRIPATTAHAIPVFLTIDFFILFLFFSCSFLFPRSGPRELASPTTTTKNWFRTNWLASYIMVTDSSQWEICRKISQSVTIQYAWNRLKTESCGNFGLVTQPCFARFPVHEPLSTKITPTLW